MGKKKAQPKAAARRRPLVKVPPAKPKAPKPKLSKAGVLQQFVSGRSDVVSHQPYGLMLNEDPSDVPINFDPRANNRYQWPDGTEFPSTVISNISEWTMTTDATFGTAAFRMFPGLLKSAVNVSPTVVGDGTISTWGGATNVTHYTELSSDFLLYRITGIMVEIVPLLGTNASNQGIISVLQAANYMNGFGASLPNPMMRRYPLWRGAYVFPQPLDLTHRAFRLLDSTIPADFDWSNFQIWITNAAVSTAVAKVIVYQRIEGHLDNDPTSILSRVALAPPSYDPLVIEAASEAYSLVNEENSTGVLDDYEPFMSKVQGFFTSALSNSESILDTIESVLGVAGRGMSLLASTGLLGRQATLKRYARNLVCSTILQPKQTAFGYFRPRSQEQYRADQRAYLLSHNLMVLAGPSLACAVVPVVDEPDEKGLDEWCSPGGPSRTTAISRVLGRVYPGH